MELELRHLFGYARRWWWLLLLLPLLAATIAYVLISRQLPMYSATATLQIRPAQQAGEGSSYGLLLEGQQLAMTYQQLVVTEPVLQPVAERLGAPFTTGGLKAVVTASTVGDTQLLKISASNTDPELAARIANEVAAQFQAFISEQELVRTGTSQAALAGLIEGAQAQIVDLQRQVSLIEAGEQTEATGQVQLQGLLTRLSQQEQSLASLLMQQQNLELGISSLQNQVRVPVPATVPGAPYAPRVLFYTVLALLLGAIVAAGTVALLEYLDNTVKSSLDFQALFGASLMSVVPTLPKLRAGSDQLFVWTHPTSNSSEAMRLLRTNVEFAAAGSEIATLMVSSAVPGEGKSTITANLGVAMSQAGFTVIVIDADLRRPSQHRIFGMANATGLTTLLTHPLMPWGDAATEISPGLRVIPSGPLPPNPADLLSSDRFRALLGQLQESVDIVLVDTPPVLAVSDPLVVATSVDGVLLVSRADSTRIDALKRAFDAFPASIRRVGVILNQQERNQSNGYYYYGYYGTGNEKAAGAVVPGRMGPQLVTAPKPSLSGTDDRA